MARFAVEGSSVPPRYCAAANSRSGGKIALRAGMRSFFPLWSFIFRMSVRARLMDVISGSLAAAVGGPLADVLGVLCRPARVFLLHDLVDCGQHGLQVQVRDRRSQKNAHSFSPSLPPRPASWRA